MDDYYGSINDNSVSVSDLAPNSDEATTEDIHTGSSTPRRTPRADSDLSDLDESHLDPIKESIEPIESIHSWPPKIWPRLGDRHIINGDSLHDGACKEGVPATESLLPAFQGQTGSVTVSQILSPLQIVTHIAPATKHRASSLGTVALPDVPSGLVMHVHSGEGREQFDEERWGSPRQIDPIEAALEQLNSATYESDDA